MDTAAIFQRTDSGRDTIKTKAVKLTQSERLLLIIIDGATPYGVLRQEVWALSAERFDRALRTLLKEGLIFEVLFPVQNQPVEELDSTVVDRFLQQDPLDPVTIISFDPEDEFGLDDNPFTEAKPAPLPDPDLIWRPPEDIVPEPVSPPAPSQVEPIASNAISVPAQSLDALLAEDAPVFLPRTPVSTVNMDEQSIGLADDLPDSWPEHQNLAQEMPGVDPIHWVYWLALGSGLVILISVLVYRSLH